MKNRSSYQQEGFTLLEILVAFSILALSLGILLNIFSTGLRSAMLSEEYIRASAIAESILAKTGIESELESGELSGEFDDKYSWNIAIEELNDESLELDRLPVIPYIVRVEVVWQGSVNGRSLVLTTLKLATKT